MRLEIHNSAGTCDVQDLVFNIRNETVTVTIDYITNTELY